MKIHSPHIPKLVREILGIPLCLHFCDLGFVPGSKEIIFIMTIMSGLKDFVGQSCWKLTALIFRSKGWEGYPCLSIGISGTPFLSNKQ